MLLTPCPYPESPGDTHHTHICLPKCPHGHRKLWNGEISPFVLSSSLPCPRLGSGAWQDSKTESRRTCYHSETLSLRTFLPLAAADGPGQGRHPSGCCRGCSVGTGMMHSHKTHSGTPGSMLGLHCSQPPRGALCEGGREGKSSR